MAIETPRALVVYHQEPDGYWAESPDAPGFSAAASTWEELERLVEDGLRFYFENEHGNLTKSGASVNIDFQLAGL